MQHPTEDAGTFIRRFANIYLNVRDQPNGVARELGRDWPV